MFISEYYIKSSSFGHNVENSTVKLKLNISATCAITLGKQKGVLIIIRVAPVMLRAAFQNNPNHAAERLCKND